MKKIAFMVALWLCVISSICQAGFTLVDPPAVGDNVYSDSGVNIAFTIIPEGFGFSIQNNTGSLMQVLWDSCAYIDPYGQSHRLVEGSTRVIHSNLTQPPTVIPPGATTSIVALPPDYLVNNKPTPLLKAPEIGQKIKLFLVYSLGSSQGQQTFTFVNMPAAPGTAVIGGKSKLTAGLWAFFIPSAGHAYAGNWLRGLPFLGVEMFLVEQTPSTTTNDKGVVEAPANWATYALLAVKVLEIMDANREVEKWNQAHGFAVTPTANGVRIAWSF